VRLGILACSCRIGSLASLQFLTGKDLAGGTGWMEMQSRSGNCVGNFGTRREALEFGRESEHGRKVWGKKVDAIMRELRGIGSAESGCSRKVAQDERRRVSSTTGKKKSIPILGNSRKIQADGSVSFPKVRFPEGSIPRVRFRRSGRKAERGGRVGSGEKADVGLTPEMSECCYFWSGIGL
jgi:hypothetical protein